MCLPTTNMNQFNKSNRTDASIPCIMWIVLKVCSMIAGEGWERGGCDDSVPLIPVGNGAKTTPPGEGAISSPYRLYHTLIYPNHINYFNKEGFV